MGNLIKNSRWLPGTTGLPAFFTFDGPFSYDDRPIGEYRSCSVCLCDDEHADICYNPGIYLSGNPFLALSYKIRAIRVDCVQYIVCFFNSLGQHTAICRRDVTTQIGRDFRSIGERIRIPENSCFARLNLSILGRTTAMTLYCPSAALLKK